MNEAFVVNSTTTGSEKIKGENLFFQKCTSFFDTSANANLQDIQYFPAFIKKICTPKSLYFVMSHIVDK